MRNEFFGDINDYHKYGLLRTLVGDGDVKVGVCWMLRPDEGSHSGRIKHLDDPERWRKYDPALFAALHHWLRKRHVRSVNLIEDSNLIGNAKYHRPFVPISMSEREDYFAQMSKTFEQTELIFFDPDNGLEITNKPYNGRPSCKHLYFREVKNIFEAQHSLLIYQQFPRQDRAKFVECRMREIQQSTGADCKNVMWIRAAHVVFYLVLREVHMEKLSTRAKAFANTWSHEQQRIEIGESIFAP